MSAAGLEQAERKMREAGINETAIEVFAHYYQQLEDGQTGLIPEGDLDPLPDPPVFEEGAGTEARALARTVVIKLNGGLGTSMGMSRAKSLLPVREGKSFLDIIVQQVRHARRAHGVQLPLLLMNSFRTRDDSLAALSAYPDLGLDGLPLDFQQNQEPKLRADDLTPVTWPVDPTLEWCPPGHGDIYPALQASGMLDSLIDKGFRYASVSNSDNLGASPSAAAAEWFAGTGAAYATEVCRRTPADRKGGHLAVRRADGHVVLRESAQTAPEDMDHFTDETRHKWFNTNSLWWDLVQLRDVLAERRGVLGLPLIRNRKTVDPTDSGSPEVFQIETAMGAAVEAFDDVAVLAVGRERFQPVKTTNDLLLVRSDCYELTDDGRLARVRDAVPQVQLDAKYYKTVADFDARFPAGPPSLVEAEALTVTGDWTFGSGVVVRGTVTLGEEGGRIADKTVLEG